MLGLVPAIRSVLSPGGPYNTQPDLLAEATPRHHLRLHSTLGLGQSDWGPGERCSVY